MKTATLIAALAIACLAPTASQAGVTMTEAQSQASALSSAIVGTPMSAVCWPDMYGNASIGGLGYPDENGVITVRFADEFSIRNSDCEAIRKILSWRTHRWDFLEWNNRLRLGIAVLDVVHESMHRKLQTHDEGVVECATYLNLWPTVAAFKLPARFARLLYASAQRAHTMHPAIDYRGNANPYRSVC